MDAFSYDLPPERIAQRPVAPRDAAKLLVVERSADVLRALTFSDLPSILHPGDVLVLNQTRVIPARFFGTIAASGVECELLLVNSIEGNLWRCIGRPLKKFSNGTELTFGAELSAEVIRRYADFEVEVRFKSRSSRSPQDLMQHLGSMPIPPYIRGGHGDLEDLSDYQSEFAKHAGSIAAPTASLHFSNDLIKRLEQRGVQIEFLTLHVGPASFLALMQDKDGTFAAPGSESYVYDEKLLDRLKQARREGRKIVAVGTTSVRALESMAKDPEQGEENRNTELFIQPGYRFQAIDQLITNFHQSGTTHLLLVEALLGRSMLERAYRFALEDGFRFLSYGDGMLVI